MTNLFQKIGEYKPDNLIADTSFPVQVGIVKVAADQGTLLRGSVLGKSDSGEYVLANSKGETPVLGSVILTDDLVTKDTAVNTQVYLSGPFNRNALIVSESDTVAAHEENLKINGIYLKVVL